MISNLNGSGSVRVHQKSGFYRFAVQVRVWFDSLVFNSSMLETLRFGENTESDILFSSLFLESKISLRTAQRNLTCIPTVSEIARLRTNCIYTNYADSTFGCLRNFEPNAAPDLKESPEGTTFNP